MAQSTPAPYSVYLADVPFEDQEGSKYRPALVVRSARGVTMVLKITSQYEGKDAAIQNLYYPIQHWQQAGLSKPSYVDTHSYFVLPTAVFTTHKQLGNLDERDAKRLVSMVRANELSQRQIRELKRDVPQRPMSLDGAILSAKRSASHDMREHDIRGIER